MRLHPFLPVLLVALLLACGGGCVIEQGGLVRGQVEHDAAAGTSKAPGPGPSESIKPTGWAEAERYPIKAMPVDVALVGQADGSAPFDADRALTDALALTQGSRAAADGEQRRLLQTRVVSFQPMRTERGMSIKVSVEVQLIDPATAGRDQEYGEAMASQPPGSPMDPELGQLAARDAFADALQRLYARIGPATR